MNMTVGLKRGTVTLKKHHDEWANLFESERTLLQKVVGDVALDIEHIGSTAIPGLLAKPIIDMLMAVRSLADVSNIQEVLEKFGYTYRENGSDDIQKLFVKGPEEHRTHYLHITEKGSSEWENSLAFRNHLRVHPDERQQYESLKQKLAVQYPDDRKRYTDGKKEFIQEVLMKVRTIGGL